MVGQPLLSGVAEHRRVPSPAQGGQLPNPVFLRIGQDDKVQARIVHLFIAHADIEQTVSLQKGFRRRPGQSGEQHPQPGLVQRRGIAVVPALRVGGEALVISLGRAVAALLYLIPDGSQKGEEGPGKIFRVPGSRPSNGLKVSQRLVLQLFQGHIGPAEVGQGDPVPAVQIIPLSENHQEQGDDQSQSDPVFPLDRPAWAGRRGRGQAHGQGPAGGPEGACVPSVDAPVKNDQREKNQQNRLTYIEQQQGNQGERIGLNVKSVAEEKQQHDNQHKCSPN